jgi:hypothetical protein
VIGATDIIIAICPAAKCVPCRHVEAARFPLEPVLRARLLSGAAGGQCGAAKEDIIVPDKWQHLQKVLRLK